MATTKTSVKQKFKKATKTAVLTGTMTAAAILGTPKKSAAQTNDRVQDRIEIMTTINQLMADSVNRHTNLVEYSKLYSNNKKLLTDIEQANSFISINSEAYTKAVKKNPAELEFIEKIQKQLDIVSKLADANIKICDIMKKHTQEDFNTTKTNLTKQRGTLAYLGGPVLDSIQIHKDTTKATTAQLKEILEQSIASKKAIEEIEATVTSVLNINLEGSYAILDVHLDVVQKQTSLLLAQINGKRGSKIETQSEYMEHLLSLIKKISEGMDYNHKFFNADYNEIKEAKAAIEKQINEISGILEFEAARGTIAKSTQNTK